MRSAYRLGSDAGTRAVSGQNQAGVARAVGETRKSSVVHQPPGRPGLGPGGWGLSSVRKRLWGLVLQ